MTKLVAAVRQLAPGNESKQQQHSSATSVRSNFVANNGSEPNLVKMTRVEALQIVAQKGVSEVWSTVDFDDWCDDIDWSHLDSATRKKKLYGKIERIKKKMARVVFEPKKEKVHTHVHEKSEDVLVGSEEGDADTMQVSNDKKIAASVQLIAGGESMNREQQETNASGEVVIANNNHKAVHDVNDSRPTTAVSNLPSLPPANNAKPEPVKAVVSANSGITEKPELGNDENNEEESGDELHPLNHFNVRRELSRKSAENRPTTAHQSRVQKMKTIKSFDEFLDDETIKKASSHHSHHSHHWDPKGMTKVMGLLSMMDRHGHGSTKDSTPKGAKKEATVQAVQADADPSMRRKRRKDYQSRRTGNSIRVFMSSTFRDFAQERDFLFRHTFPQLENRCNDRGLFFVPVDLRWGVTAEECMHGDVIKLCLQEIDESYPFFLCMLGERYGWHQENAGDDKLLNKTFDEAQKYFPWVDKWRTASATEMEIRHAVLNHKSLNKAMPHTFFYMRDPKFVETVPEKERSGYVCATDFARQKLAELKDEIRERMPLERVKDYSDIPTVCKQIADDIWAAIERDFPHMEHIEDEDVQQVMHERHEHETAASRKLKLYVVSNKGYMDVLDNRLAKAQTGGAHILVVGSHGTGKTALVANWAHAHHSNPNSKVFIVEHYIGATANSKSDVSLMSRIMNEIIHHFHEMFADFERPKSAAAMVQTFPSFLELAGQSALDNGEIIIIVIDNLSSLAADQQRLEWLPESTSAGICLVLTSTVELDIDPRELAMHRVSSRLHQDIKFQLENSNTNSENSFPRTKPSSNKSRRRQSTCLTHIIRKKQSLFMPPSVRECQRRDWPTLEIQNMDESTTLMVIEHFFDIYGKKLSEEQEEALLASPNTRNPQYLITVMEELRSFGVFEQVSSVIEDYLQADNLEKLFERIIKKREEEYGEKMVKDFFSLVACSEDGLTEDEIVELLGVSRGNPYASFRLSCRELVLVQSGRTVIRQTEVKEAIHHLYDEDSFLKLHATLAKFLQERLDQHRADRSQIHTDHCHNSDHSGVQTSAQRGFRRQELRFVIFLSSINFHSKQARKLSYCFIP